MMLPRPEVVRCFSVRTFENPLPAMELAWDADEGGASEHVWNLPDCVTLKGSPPRRFGITIQRLDHDSYRVRVLWNRLLLAWDDLTCVQVMTSSLTQILKALGTDVWYLLNQPVNDLSQAA